MKNTIHGPFTTDIGDGPEQFASLAEVQHAVATRVSGVRSSGAWYRYMRSPNGATVRDASGRVVASVSYNARLWRPGRVARDEIVL